MLDQAQLETLREDALKDVEKEAKKYIIVNSPGRGSISSLSHLHSVLEIVHTRMPIVMKYNQDPREPDTKLPVTQPRGIFTTPAKLSQLPSSYLDGSFLVSVKGKEADPYVDPTKLKMGLVTAQGVSIAKGKKGKEAESEERKPFYPAVNKWNTYQAKEGGGQRLGAPFPYVEHKEHAIKKPLPKDDKGNFSLNRGRQFVDVMKPNPQATALHPGHYNSTVGHTINKFPEYKPQGYGQLQKNDFVGFYSSSLKERNGIRS